MSKVGKRLTITAEEDLGSRKKIRLVRKSKERYLTGLLRICSNIFEITRFVSMNSAEVLKSTQAALPECNDC